MHAWMDATFAIASGTDMEVNEQPDGSFEFAWQRPALEGGVAGLSVRVDRAMAEDMLSRLATLLSPRQAEAG